jgi:regulator of sigma E protease
MVSIISGAPGRNIALEIMRDGARSTIQLVPAETADRGRSIGRIGVTVKEGSFDKAALVAIVRYGPLESLQKAAAQTWDTSVFSLRMMGRMITGDVSWKNLSGPVTIADYAGQSARLGLPYYIRFLALISISLGVLNLLPIPLLDGGHLMYYIVEIIKGGPVSERVMEIGQQIGMALLVILMAFAFYNDINRLISG